MVHRDRAPAYTGAVADIGFLLLITGFFAVCVAFVRGCERIIGPDPATADPAAEATGGDDPTATGDLDQPEDRDDEVPA